MFLQHQTDLQGYSTWHYGNVEPEKVLVPAMRKLLLRQIIWSPQSYPVVKN